MLDTILSARPIRILHVWCSFAFGILYLGFNLVYVLAGGMDFDGNNFIYNILDWNERPLRSVGFSFGAIVSVAVAHVFLWAIAKGSERIWSPNSCCHNKVGDEELMIV